MKNGLYELINCNFDKAFISINQTIAIITKILFERKYFIFMIFELMHQRFDHLKIYKLKNLHLYAHEMNQFKILKDFDCNVCDVMKMIKIINKKSYIKITISAAKMHIDFWNKFFIDNIKKGYVYFVSFIDKTIERAMIRFIVFKIEIHNFLIHEIKHLLIENKKSMMCIYIDNALKYKIIEKELRDMNIYMKFIIIYIVY